MANSTLALPVRSFGATFAGMFAYLFVALGGALGSLARFVVSDWVGARWGGFPLGTLVVNVSGSLLIGFLSAWGEGQGGGLVSSPGFRQLMLVGVCGGYTTFSAFSLQTLNLARGGDWLLAGANAVLSLVVCLLAVWVGHRLAFGLFWGK